MRRNRPFLRGVGSWTAEAFASLWENAPHVLSRDQNYDVTGLDRVPFGAPSPVGRVYTNAVRMLGLGRVSVYCHRSRGPLQVAVALMVPPALILTGEIVDGAEMQYRLSCMLAATMPANVMLFGLPEAKVRVLLWAMIAAVGPPGESKGTESTTVQLAGSLWHALPARVQRRLNEIFAHPEGITYEDTWARALQCTRRAGLYVVGDLGTALRETLYDPDVRSAVDSSSPNLLRQLCEVSSSAADLVRLATSSEYAEARWRTNASERLGTSLDGA